MAQTQEQRLARIQEIDGQISKMRDSTAALTDERTRLVTEYVDGLPKEIVDEIKARP